MSVGSPSIHHTYANIKYSYLLIQQMHMYLICLRHKYSHQRNEEWFLRELIVLSYVRKENK
jgi:hypothetical protein